MLAFWLFHVVLYMEYSLLIEESSPDFLWSSFTFQISTTSLSIWHSLSTHYTLHKLSKIQNVFKRNHSTSTSRFAYACPFYHRRSSRRNEPGRGTGDFSGSHFKTNPGLVKRSWGTHQAQTIGIRYKLHPTELLSMKFSEFKTCRRFEFVTQLLARIVKSLSMTAQQPSLVVTTSITASFKTSWTMSTTTVSYEARPLLDWWAMLTMKKNFHSTYPEPYGLVILTLYLPQGSSRWFVQRLIHLDLQQLAGTTTSKLVRYLSIEYLNRPHIIP
jgi:hypothetical protein